MSEMLISTANMGQLLGESLTSTFCVNIEATSKIWVATGMLVQYLESFTDGIVVRKNEKPVGIVGGRDIIANIAKNPRGEFFEEPVESIVESRIPEISSRTTYKELMNFWQDTGRAFAIIQNEYGDYSSISAKKILEIAKQCNTNLKISEMPKKNTVTFSLDEPIGQIMDRMLENKTRRVILKDTNKFINDRAILEKISEELDYLRNVKNFREFPAKDFNIIETTMIEKDLMIPETAQMMYELEHPYLVYKDNVITPWDICKILLSDKITINN